jgi:putative transposase
MRVLEDENHKLEQLVADLSLDKHMLQEVIAKKLRSRRSVVGLSIF